MTDIEREIKIGKHVINIFNLKLKKNGLVSTQWGDKSIQGIGATILTIVNDIK